MKGIPEKKRFISAIGLILVTGFLAVSLISYFSAYSSLSKGLRDDILPLTGDNIYSEIQKDLIRLIFISSMMASDTFLRDWVIDGETDPNHINKYLAEVQSRYNTVTSFFVSESSRIYYHSKGILKKIKEEEERDRWYFRVREMNSPYEINVDFDMANKDAVTIFINYRVLDYQGNYIGATGCGLTVTAVKALLDEYAKRYQRSIYFTDRAGNVTLASTHNRPPFSSLQDVPELRALRLDLQNPTSTTTSYMRGQEKVLLNTRYINEFGWHLFVEQSLKKDTGYIRRTLLENLVISLLVSVLILFAVYRMMNRYQSRLESMATKDKLTGLTNRHAYEKFFTQALKETQRSGSPLSLILLDLDCFKQVNDFYGHPAGDAVLRSTAKRIMASFREVDVICRWGGEEFMILLKDCSQDNAYRLAENLRETIARAPVGYQQHSISVKASIGVAQLAPGESRNRLLMRVDKALYLAKRKGRNRTEIAAEATESD